MADENTGVSSAGGNTKKKANKKEKRTGGNESSPPRVFPGVINENARKTLISSLRTILPLAATYTGKVTPKAETAGELDLAENELDLLSDAAVKLFSESIELSSLTYPIGPEAKAYKAQIDPDTGKFPAPNLTQLLSLVPGVQGLLGLGGERQTATLDIPKILSALQQMKVPTQPEVAPSVISAPPRQIRALAMSQALPKMSQVAVKMVPQSQKINQMQMGAKQGGSVAGPCTCCGESASATTQMARYGENGECAELWCISCETKWRLRNCFKEFICNFLYCASSHLDENGKIKTTNVTTHETNEVGDVLGECLLTAFGSLVRCIPDAICGPRGSQPCPPKLDPECNFAVEEVR